MARTSYRGVCIELCGMEVEVGVDFKILNFGSPDSYDPMYGATGGDSPEIEIEKVWYLNDPTETDVSARLSELRDLRLPYMLTKPDKLDYGYGFVLLHGAVLAGYGGKGKALKPVRLLPAIKFNNGRSILEGIEEEIYYNLSDHDSDDYDD